MRVITTTLLTLVITAATVATQDSSHDTLDIYVIDVEGGEATLFVSPSGESMLVDAGWPGFDGRDADRIATTFQPPITAASARAARAKSASTHGGSAKATGGGAVSDERVADCSGTLNGLKPNRSINPSCREIAPTSLRFALAFQ